MAICNYCDQVVGIVDGKLVNHGFKTAFYVFGDLCIGSGAPFSADCCSK